MMEEDALFAGCFYDCLNSHSAQISFEYLNEKLLKPKEELHNRGNTLKSSWEHTILKEASQDTAWVAPLAQHD